MAENKFLKSSKHLIKERKHFFFKYCTMSVHHDGCTVYYLMLTIKLQFIVSKFTETEYCQETYKYFVGFWDILYFFLFFPLE